MKPYSLGDTSIKRPRHMLQTPTLWMSHVCLPPGWTGSQYCLKRLFLQTYPLDEFNNLTLCMMTTEQVLPRHWEDTYTLSVTQTNILSDVRTATLVLLVPWVIHMSNMLAQHKTYTEAEIRLCDLYKKSPNSSMLCCVSVWTVTWTNITNNKTTATTHFCMVGITHLEQNPSNYSDRLLISDSPRICRWANVLKSLTCRMM